MGGANNRSLISAHFCISVYFLTAETYKHMRLTTRVYSMVAEIVAMIAIFTCTRTRTYRMRMHPETPVYGVHVHVN